MIILTGNFLYNHGVCNILVSIPIFLCIEVHDHGFNISIF